MHKQNLRFVFCAMWICSAGTVTSAATTSIDQIRPSCSSVSTMACLPPAPSKHSEVGALMREADNRLRASIEMAVLANTLPPELGFAGHSYDCCKIKSHAISAPSKTPASYAVSFLILTTSIGLGYNLTHAHRAVQRRKRRYTIDRTDPSLLPKILVSWTTPLRRRNPLTHA